MHQEGLVHQHITNTYRYQHFGYLRPLQLHLRRMHEWRWLHFRRQSRDNSSCWDSSSVFTVLSGNENRYRTSSLKNKSRMVPSLSSRILFFSLSWSDQDVQPKPQVYGSFSLSTILLWVRWNPPRPGCRELFHLLSGDRVRPAVSPRDGHRYSSWLSWSSNGIIIDRHFVQIGGRASVRCGPSEVTGQPHLRQNQGGSRSRPQPCIY